MNRHLLYSLLLFLIASCQSIERLPSIHRKTKTVDRLPSKAKITLEEVSSRSYENHIEFDFQIHDQDGNLYQMNSVDNVIKKVEVKRNGKWEELDPNEVKILPSSILSCEPKDYCIFLDISGSMFDERKAIYKEAKEFINHKNEFDHVSLIKYATNPIIACDYSVNKDELIQALNNTTHDTLKRGTRTQVAYKAFLDSLRDHPSKQLEVLIFSDLSGFSNIELTSMYQEAFNDSIKTHRIIYRKNVRRSGYTKKGKKRIMDTYNFPYGSSYIVENIGSIGRYLSHLVDENCLTNTIELPIYQDGKNEYRVQVNIGGEEHTLEHQHNYVEPIHIESAFNLDTTNLLNIQFKTGSAELLEMSLVEIEKVKTFMNNHPNIKIKIHGHTDNQGNYDYNMNLSKRRAKTVMDKLIEMGIEKGRMHSDGFGYTVPIATNETAFGRQQNRRTEFIVIRNK